MDIIISPFFPVHWILLVTAGVLAFVWYVERTLLSQWLLGGLIVLLGLLALKPAIVSQTIVTPDKPVTVVFENGLSQLRDGIESEARDLVGRLSDRLPGAQVRVVPLDGRWERPPVFRDYNRLSRDRSTEGSLRIVVGSGRHTRPGIGPDISTAQTGYRAHLRVTDADTSVASIRSVKPVIQRSSPGSSSWRFNVTEADRLTSPVLRIREGDQVIRRRSISGADNLTVTVETPERGQGQYYFVAELLAEGDTGLPVGHPRRTGLGLSISEDRRRVRLNGTRPGWSTGWWGRKINGFGEWETDYRYRNFSAEADGDPSRSPDVVVYKGFPESDGAMNQFRSAVEDSARLLWIPDDPTAGGRWVESALELVGLRSNGTPVSRQGQFQPRLTDAAGESFPSLARYDYVISSSPPVSRVVGNIVPGESYQTVLEAGSSPMLAVSDRRGIALLLSPRFHRWAMTWGRLGRPDVGGELAREIIGKMMRTDDQQTRRLDRRWTRAGDPVTVRGRSDTAPLVVRSGDRESEDYTFEDGQLTFSRPGRYRVTEPGSNWSESILVVEPDEERIPEGGLLVRDLATEETTFSSRTELLNWAEGAWEEQSRERRQRLVGWNHFMVLILLVGLLAGTWISRDRGGRWW